MIRHDVLREAVEARGLSVTEAAGLLGISVPHMSAVLRGRKGMSMRLFERACVEFEIDPKNLIFDVYKVL